MSANPGEDPLQTLRTLTERAAVYRRVLAPLMIYAGTVGVISAVLAERQHLRASNTFALYWLCVAAVAGVGVLVLLRLQALRERQPIGSAPARCVLRAVAPLLLIGLALGLIEVIWPAEGGNPLFQSQPRPAITRLIALWLMCYGAALHAGGFFMTRGLRLFGWCAIILGVALLTAMNVKGVTGRLPAPVDRYAHWIMGLVFGAGHLMYGLYLYFTEDNPAAP